MKTTRHFLIWTFLLPLSSCCLLGIGDCDDPVTNQAINGCTDLYSFNYNSSATQNDGSCKTMAGCTGYASGMPNSGTLSNTFGNYYYDQKMTQEIQIQSQFFDCCPASFHVIYEPSVQQRNAYATFEKQILFGYHMFYYSIQNYGELAAAGILAHEWGHITQYYHGWNSGVPYMELEADAFSGFYMALAKQWAWSQIQGYFANVYATGDYNFNSPTHHGTNHERLASAYLGVTTAIEVLNAGSPKSYQDLHSYFQQKIKNEIAPRGGRRNFDEVTYPENLTPEYIRSLFPYEAEE